MRWQRPPGGVVDTALSEGGYRFHAEVDVTVGTWTYRWAYDYRDRRVKEYQKVGAGAETQIKTFIWDGDDLIQERNGANTITRTHHFGGFADGTTGATKYETTTDHLGNVREVIAASGTTPAIGTVVARYEYTTFQGPVKVYSAAVGNVDASVLTIGRYYHKVLGAGLDLELALYRAYDPALGRWISEDPIGESGGINLYAFVENRVTSDVDSLGLAVKDSANFTIVRKRGEGQFWAAKWPTDKRRIVFSVTKSLSVEIRFDDGSLARIGPKAGVLIVCPAPLRPSDCFRSNLRASGGECGGPNTDHYIPKKSPNVVTPSAPIP